VSDHGVLPVLWPIHGDGVLARRGDLVLLIHPAGGAFTDHLLDLLAATAQAGESGPRFADLVSAEFDAHAAAADTTVDEHGPAVVAFGPADGGTALAVYGTGWAEVTNARGVQRLTAGEPYGRLRCVLPSRLIKIRAGVEAAADGETDPYLRLADGVVRAVALVYAAAESPGEKDLGLAAGQMGRRPPPGVLVLPDGSVCQLDAEYVMGREPTLDTSVADGRARPLRLTDPSGQVSRVHARVELDGGQVFISDLNSPNGTHILRPGENAPTRLEPGVRVPLVGGTRIRLGGEYELRYESHHRPGETGQRVHSPRAAGQAPGGPPTPDAYAAQPVPEAPGPGAAPAPGPEDSGHAAPARRDSISISAPGSGASSEVPQQTAMPVGAAPPGPYYRGTEIAASGTGRPTGAGQHSPVAEQRFLQGRFPERVRLSEEVSLLVRLGLQPGAPLEAALRPLTVPAGGLEVVLLLVDSPGFTLHSPDRTVVHVVPRLDSNWAGFELQATREGVHTLQVEAFAGGSGLGGLAVQVSVDAAAPTGPLVERNSPARVAAADPGEVSLLLSFDSVQQVYRYRLVDSSGYYSEESASDRLLQPPGEAIEQLVAGLNAVARGRPAWDAATTTDWLKGQGIALWNSFIPQALQREFWQRRDKISRMTIVSQGDPVPWELLYPFAPGGWDAGFLIDQFPVARRRYGPPPPGRLELGAADLVLSGDGWPAAASAEIAALDGLLRGCGLTAHRIGDLPSLLQAFQRGNLGLLHFSCHNAFARGAPNTCKILLQNQPFEPVFLEQHAGRFTAPLVFLNACRTDGQAPLYTTVEGWAASFLRAGAGAFIGSLWEVADTSASTYAQEFYRAAIGGATLGESARRARDAIRDNPGDPTWLAYTFYGDPAATFSTASSA
jgi:CHAT domain/FHA domain